MIELCIGHYYTFGTEMRYLQDAHASFLIDGDSYVRENIQRFLNNLQALELKVTERASWRLIDFLNNLESSDESPSLGEEKASLLREIMNEIRHTLDAEIAGMSAYTVTPKRLDSEKLLQNVSHLFAPDVFQLFSDIAKYDFNEAGKCIAFERPTAAAFHILRATEANLRLYYKNMVRQNRITSEMWGNIVADLREKNRTKKYTILNNQLDNIRHSFRNPTQHPEAIYDIHEVQDLLSICVDVNNRMFRTLLDEDRIPQTC